MSLLLSVPAGALAQQGNVDEITVPLSDPGRPATVRADLIEGSITVRGYGGQDVVVSADRQSPRREPDEASGMRRIMVGGTGLQVTEDDNVVRINPGIPGNTKNLTIQVPVATSVKAGTVNGAEVLVEGVSGEIEATAVNGNVKVVDVAGSVVANSVNGDVIVSFDEVAPGKLMSFSTLNGKIDVTFPPDVQATVKLESENGEIYTDFDLAMRRQARGPDVQDNRSEGGRYKAKFERTAYGDINGGGPEYHFKSLNGNIYIRKAQ